MTLQETELISISFQIRDPASSSLINVQSVRPCRSIYTGHNAATRPGNSHFVRKEARPLLPPRPTTYRRYKFSRRTRR